MKTRIVNGISAEGVHHVAYSEWGQQDPEHPAVICVHGYTRNRHDFDSLASYLSLNDHHVFCPDIVGRGDSCWFKNSSHYNFTQYISDMNALIARTQSNQIDWIGTSMGGLIGMMLAALPNTPIRHLILNDVGPQVPIYGLKRLAKYAGHDPQFKTLEEGKEYFKKNYGQFGPLTEKEWDYLTLHSLEQRSPNLYVSKVDPGIKNPKTSIQLISEFFHHPHRALEGILYDVDLWDVWKKVRCPVMVIHGTHSDILTPEIIRKMHRTHKDMLVYEKTNAGHAPALLELIDHQTIEHWLKV